MKIDRVIKIKLNKEEKLYDFELKKNHNFYASINGDPDNYVLLHNCDGIHIRSLLLTFFEKFCPKMLNDGRIVMMETPIILGYDKKGNVKKWFFKLDDYYEYEKKEGKSSEITFKYCKGLGSLKPRDLDPILEELGSIDKLLYSFKNTDDSHESLMNWMSSKTVDSRKEMLIGKSCNISEV